MSKADRIYSINVNIGEKYEVIVCGGGTAGCVAAIAAAREGARVLLIERSFAVGGMLTIGNAGITKYTVHYTDAQDYRDKVLWQLGNSPESVQVAGGIAKEYCHRMMDNRGALGTEGQVGSYVFTDRYESQFAMMDMLEEAGVEILYDSKVCQVSMEGNKIVGVVVFNKSGFTEYPADRFIDATGDADVAAMAGADFVIGTTQEDIEEGCGAFVGQLLSCGSMYRVRNVDLKRLLEYLKEHPENYRVHPYGVMMIDDVVASTEAGEMLVFHMMVDMPDGSQNILQIYNAPASDEVILLPGNQGVSVNGLDAMALSNGQTTLWKKVRESFEHYKKVIPGFECARMSFLPDIGVRETRRIKGDYWLTGMEVLEGKDFEDSIGCGGHPIDIGPLKEDIKNHPYENWRFHMPYRIMLPRGIENLLVAGRSVSASRMASGCIRPTVQCMVLGEAAGTAAALSVKDGVSCRDVDVKKLREKLIENGAVV